MAEHSGSGDRNKENPENSFQQTFYVPEEQLFQRIPLCQYLSDLSTLFENEDLADESEGKAEEKGKS